MRTVEGSLLVVAMAIIGIIAYFVLTIKKNDSTTTELNVKLTLLLSGAALSIGLFIYKFIMRS
ncbi:MAG: hypothetical protein ACRCWR_09080 [Saezia sp.]